MSQVFAMHLPSSYDRLPKEGRDRRRAQHVQSPTNHFPGLSPWGNRSAVLPFRFNFTLRGASFRLEGWKLRPRTTDGPFIPSTPLNAPIVAMWTARMSTSFTIKTAEEGEAIAHTIANDASPVAKETTTTCRLFACFVCDSTFQPPRRVLLTSKSHLLPHSRPNPPTNPSGP